jgi:hypothetical protein
MKSKEKILNRIYKACFIYAQIKEKLFEDWKWVSEVLENGLEDRIPIEILYCIDLWLDAEFNLTF